MALPHLLSLILLLLLAVGVVATDTRSLREAANGTGIYVGSSMNYPYLTEDGYYKQVGAQQYNLLTAGNACKMGATWKDYTHYDFTKCDYVITFAEANDMAVRGHNLVWVTDKSTLLPAFVREEKNATTLESRLLEYIDSVVTHVGERAFAWDVINEAISDKPDELIKHSPWSKIDDFVCKAF